MEGAVLEKPWLINRFAEVNRRIQIEREKVSIRAANRIVKPLFRQSEIAGARPEFLATAMMVKAARVRQQLTQAELAEKADCTFQVISLIETAQRSAGEYGPRIFAALGI